jgi:hypothetical protein
MNRIKNLLKAGTLVQHKLQSGLLGAGTVIQDSKFGNVAVCWERQRNRVIEVGAVFCVNGNGKTREGTTFTNWWQSERVQDLVWSGDFGGKEDR